MNRLLPALAVGCMLMLAGCASLGQISSAYTALADASVPAKQVIIAANAFDGIEVAATTYVRYCAPNPSPAGCDDALIRNKVIPAVNAGIQARDGLEGFLKSHPGALGSKGLFDALNQSTATLTAMSAQFAVAK
jgi:hypothetical protein